MAIHPSSVTERGDALDALENGALNSKGTFYHPEETPSADELPHSHKFPAIKPDYQSQERRTNRTDSQTGDPEFILQERESIEEARSQKNRPELETPPSKRVYLTFDPNIESQAGRFSYQKLTDLWGKEDTKITYSRGFDEFDTNITFSDPSGQEKTTIPLWIIRNAANRAARTEDTVNEARRGQADLTIKALLSPNVSPSKIEEILHSFCLEERDKLATKEKMAYIDTRHQLEIPLQSFEVIPQGFTRRQAEEWFSAWKNIDNPIQSIDFIGKDGSILAIKVIQRSGVAHTITLEDFNRVAKAKDPNSLVIDRQKIDPEEISKDPNPTIEFFRHLRVNGQPHPDIKKVSYLP